MKRLFFLAVFAACTLVTSLLFAEEIVHVIQKGDTLYSLGKKYGLSVDEICSYNNMSDSSKIKLGQRIKIPQDESASSIHITAVAETVSKYKVQSGDTLFGIARQFNTSVSELRSANNMNESSTLRSGLVILIPSAAKASSSYASIKQLPPTSVDDAPELDTSLEDPRSYKVKAVDSKIVWPVKATEMSYVSGKTNSVLLNGDRGDSVTAIKSGLVIFSGLYRGFGRVVFVQPKASEYVYVYSGLDTIAVRKGDSVDFGAKIGTLGVDTLTKKPQLNFMVFKNGTAVDPASAPRG